jgi:hypothetical protein
MRALYQCSVFLEFSQPIHSIWATKQTVLKKKINNELQGVNSMNSFRILFCRLTVPALSDKLSNC